MDYNNPKSWSDTEAINATPDISEVSRTAELVSPWPDCTASLEHCIHITLTGVTPQVYADMKPCIERYVEELGVEQVAFALKAATDTIIKSLCSVSPGHLHFTAGELEHRVSLPISINPEAR